MPKANKQNEDGSFHEGFALYIVFNLIATFYCSFWDYYYDWGLCRSRKSGSYALREKKTFKPWVYYLAIFLNQTFRFYWVIGIFYYPYMTKTKDDEGNDNTDMRNVRL